MRAQLIQYVDLLFAGTEGCGDIHQEILQNTLDRYDDLILEGKAPEAAYRLAILSIGDIHEIIGGSSPSPASRQIPRTTADKKVLAFPKKKWILVAVAAALVVLGFIIGALGLNFVAVKRSADIYPAETAIPQQIDESTGNTFYVEETTNIRSKPSPMGEVLGAVEGGTTIHLTRDEMINGEHWGYVLEPVQGWIWLGSGVEETAAAESPATEPTIIVDPNVTVPSADSSDAIARGYGCNASDVSDISIEWAAGNIQIIPVEGNRINVEETGDFEKHPMVLKNRNGKLSIEYCEEKSKLAIGLNYDFSKDLTIEIPKDFYLRELEIEAASATVSVRSLKAGLVEFEGASGICEFIDCDVDKLNVDTASGDVQFVGSLNLLECDAASASFTALLWNVPSKLEMESMSGNLDVTLPEDAGFTVTMEGMNSDFHSDFETTIRNKSYVAGDGACRIQMEALSGDVTVRKG